MRIDCFLGNTICHSHPLAFRIEMLEAQLLNCSKNIVGEKQKEDMLNLLEDKAKFEAMSKEALK